MSTVIEKKFVGQVAAEQIVANVKDALNGKQPRGDYALASDKKVNPNAITFTGAVTGTYDGSSAVTINVPTIAGETGPQGVGIVDVTIVEA